MKCSRIGFVTRTTRTDLLFFFQLLSVLMRSTKCRTKTAVYSAITVDEHTMHKIHSKDCTEISYVYKFKRKRWKKRTSTRKHNDENNSEGGRRGNFIIESFKVNLSANVLLPRTMRHFIDEMKRRNSLNTFYVKIYKLYWAHFTAWYGKIFRSCAKWWGDRTNSMFAEV